MMEQTPAIGIDLGTTLSGGSVYRQGKCEMIPNIEGQRLTPSLVYYDPKSANVFVGTTAEDKAIECIENLVFDVKRIIGRKFDDAYVKEMRQSQNFRYKIVRGKQDRAEIELTHNGVVVRKSPEEISSEILKYIKESAREYLGEDVTEAVISIPAYFSNAQRKATKVAAELAGFKVLKLITEPVAAAIHYAEDRLEQSSTLLVFDFGGGTLDVSIVEVDGKSFEVKNIEGDTYLGGRDFDDLLLDYFKSKIIEEYGNKVLNPKGLWRIKKRCTTLKTKLSSYEEFSLPMFSISGVDETKFTFSMTRKEFEKITKVLFVRAYSLVNKCITDAGLNKDDITDVILVGGSSRIPKVREMLTIFFSKEKVKTNLNPDEAVALGTGIQAALLKQQFKELEKYKITEIAPLSLGLDVTQGLMCVVIKKNSPLPTKGDTICRTVANDQKQVNFRVFEGERKMCQYNNLLGEFDLKGLPPGKAGNVEIKIVFTLNEDGILEIEAEETTTGKKNKLTVTIGEFHLCDYKIRTALESAVKNKKVDDEFEVFSIHKFWMIEKCNQIMYDIIKVPLVGDRFIVQRSIGIFLMELNNFHYTQLKDLEEKFKSLLKTVMRIIDGYIDIGIEVRRPMPIPIPMEVFFHNFQRFLQMDEAPLGNVSTRDRNARPSSLKSISHKNQSNKKPK